MILPIIIGVGVTAGILLFGKSADLQEFADKVNYKIDVKWMKLRLDGISLVVDIDFTITLINPTKTKLSFRHPSLILLRNGSEIGRNKFFTPKKYEIKPYSTLNLNPTIISITLNSLLIDAASLLSEIFEYAKKLDIVGAQAVFEKHQDRILKTLSVQVSTEINGIPLVIDETLAGGSALGYIALGNAPVSAIERKIQDGSKFEKYFSMPKGGRKLIIKDGTVEQTVRAMIDIVNQDAHLIKKASEELFKRDTVKATAKAIFDWIYKYIKYNIEEGEQLRNPLMVYHLGQRLAYPFYKKNGYFHKDYTVDCDDISIFVASVLKNLNIPYLFRIASYRDYLGKDNGFSHVYAVIPLQNGQEIIIDPVYYAFDAEKIFNNKKDFFMTKKRLNGIDVYYLNGLGNPKSNSTLANALNVLNGVKEKDNDDDSMYDYLVASRNTIAQNPEKLKVKLPGKDMVAMYDYALKHWNTTRRARALRHLAVAEHVLKQKGLLGAMEDDFFNELSGERWDKFKGKVKKLWHKGKGLVQKNYAKDSAEDTVEREKSSNRDENEREKSSNKDESDNGSKTATKSFSAIVAKYKIPIAIVGGLAAVGITYALTRKKKKPEKLNGVSVSKKTQLKKPNPKSKRLGTIKLT